jgi:hypothetical protein
MRALSDPGRELGERVLPDDPLGVQLPEKVA